MAFVSINEDYLTNIGNAIRAKNNTSELYKPREMADAISNLTITYIGETHCVPKGTTKIEAYYMQDVQDVCCVFIPKSVTRIEPLAFVDCPNLNTVIFEDADNGLSIGSNAFKGCPLLQIVQLSYQMDINAFTTSPWGSTNSYPSFIVYGDEEV